MTKLLKDMNSREFLALFEREGEPRLSMYRGHVEYYGDLRVREARERIKAAIVKEFTCICDKAWQVRGIRPDPRCHFCNAVRYCIEIVDESEGMAKQTEEPVRRSDGKIMCMACCNGDRCDDPMHYDRAECPVCKGTGAIPEPEEQTAEAWLIQNTPPGTDELRDWRAVRAMCREYGDRRAQEEREKVLAEAKAELQEVQSLIRRHEPKAHTMNCAVSQSRACDCGAMP